MNKKIKISKKELKRLYYKKDFNIIQIAKKLNVSRETISSRIKEYNLKIKDRRHLINLPKEELIKRYTKENLTTTKIAEVFKCNAGTICKRLREYGVFVNPNPQYKHISKEVLAELYTKNKLSPRQISKKLGCSKNIIRDKLKKYGIKIRSKSEAGKLIKREEKYKIDPIELKNLYHNKKLSMQQIADKYNFKHSSLISNKFKKYNIKSRTLKEGIKISIPRRSRSIAKAVIKYPKKEFSGDKIEKSYLFGFAMGDLHITKRKYGATIRMETSTTKEVQVNLVKNLFNSYTYVNISKSKLGQYQISCNLSLSFDFLLKYKRDKIPNWVLINKNNFLSFFGGYIDAEGYFGTPNNIGAFKIGSYDKNTLFEIVNNLKKFNIKAEGPKITRRKGYIDKRGVRWNNDMWVVRIRRMRELYKFINLIKPYIKHKKRYENMINVEKNLLGRNTKINLNEEMKINDKK